MPIKQVKFGPFKGYQSSVEAVMSPPDFIVGDINGSDTNSSRDMLLDPGSGMWFRRKGCVIFGDTLAAGSEVTGLLESGMAFSARARRVFKLKSPSLTDGYTTPAILYSMEQNTASFPGADTGWFGTVYARNSNGSGENYNLLADFSSHYPTGTIDGSGGEIGSFDPGATGMVICPPLWYESGEGGYTRGAFRFARQLLTPGARTPVTVGNKVAFPNLRGTPIWWDGSLNNISGSATTNNVTVQPLGPFAPIHPGTYGGATAAGTNNGVWSDGDTFYFSVIYQYEDGSYSQPFLPRAANATLTTAIGQAIIGTIGLTGKYSSWSWTNIPIGPPGVIARLLLRTPKQARAAATDVITLSPFDLRVTGILTNNTQTTYTDSAGSDVGLIDNDNIIKLTNLCPRRARYFWTGDQRLQLGYSLPNPCAIQLAPVSNASNSAYDLNLPPTFALGTSGFVYRVTTTQLELYKFIPAAASVNLSTVVAIDWATYPTIQDVVDKINNSVIADNAKRWRAQISPGADPSAASSGLCPTVWTTTAHCGTTNNSPTLTSSTGDFGNIPIGYVINCTNVPSGTYVVSKTSASQLTMSANATATSAPNTLTADFYAFCGDGTNAVNFWAVVGPTNKPGCIRAFGASYPGMIYFRRTALTGYASADKQKVYFTVGSPGAASAGGSVAINCWGASNDLLPSISNPGNILGGTDIEGASIVAYQHGVAMFKNIRGANTGEDFDYKLFSVNSTRGPVSWSAFVSGDGWAAYVTREGVFATDKNMREFALGGAIYNSARGLGDIVYEVNKSIAATDSDSDDSFLYLSVLRTKLALSYRDASGPTISNSVLWYDFSPGVEASGVEELVSPDTKQSYGWSSPSKYNSVAVKGPGPMAAIPSSSGMLYFGAVESNSGSRNGRLEKIETGNDDNGTAFTGYGFLPHMIADDFMRLSPQRIQVLHKHAAGSFVTLTHCTCPGVGTPTLTTTAGGGDTSSVPVGSYVYSVNGGLQSPLANIVLANDGTTITITSGIIASDVTIVFESFLGVNINVSRDQAFASSNAYVLGNSTGVQFTYEMVQLKTNPDRSPTDLIWLEYSDAETTQGNGFWTVAFQYQDLPL